MSTTILSVLDTQAITLSFLIPEEDFLAQYTHLEVWRSEGGEGGPYLPMFDITWLPARLPGDAGPEGNTTGGNLNIVGKKLEFEVNDTLLFSHVLTGTDPLTKQECADQLQAAFPAYVDAYVDATGQFVLETVGIGHLAALKVLAGDAAALLNLPVDELARGKDVRVALLPGVESYSFTDPYGKPEYYYKTRLYNELDRSVTEFSNPITGKVRTAVMPERIAIGYVQLVGLDGRALQHQEVQVHSSFSSTILDGYTVTGGTQRTLTNENGYAEFVLLRGTKIDVALPGTALVQQVTVPTDAAVTKFNLFDPAYGNNDAFAVQRVDFPYAERRTL